MGPAFLCARTNLLVTCIWVLVLLFPETVQAGAEGSPPQSGTAGPDQSSMTVAGSDLGSDGQGQWVAQGDDLPEEPPSEPIGLPLTPGGQAQDESGESQSEASEPELAPRNDLLSAPAFNRIEQDDPAWVYFGSWSNHALARASGASYWRTASAGNTAGLSFDGSWISLGFISDRFSGEAEVFIDGVSQGIVDLYRNGEAPVSVLFDGFAPGQHLLELQVLGTANTFASGTRVQLDYADFGDGSLLADGNFEQDDERLLISGGWTTVAYAGASGESYIRSGAGTAWFPFAGDSFSLQTIAHSNAGKAQLFVDGVYLDTIDMFAPVFSSAAIARSFSYDGLGSGPHVLQIMSYQDQVTIDALVTPGTGPFIDPDPPVTGVTRFEDDHPGLLYNGVPFTQTASSWVRVANIVSTRASDGAYIYSATAEDNVAFEFEGNWVGVGFATDRFGGQAEIAIDGQVLETVDLYSRFEDTASFYFRDLGAGPHVVTITVLGTSHPNAIGTRVAVDFIDVWDGQSLPDGTFEEDDDRLFFSNGWTRILNASASGGAFGISGVNANTTVWFPFTGDSITWQGWTRSNYQDVDVRLNGVSVGLFDIYSYDEGTRTHSFDKLGPGPHVLELRRYRSAVTIDAFMTPAVEAGYQPPAPAPFVRHEEDHPALRYNGEPYRTMPQTWNESSNFQNSGGYNLISSTPGDSWRLDFEGHWLNIGFRSSGTSGMAEIILDGVSQGIFDTSDGINNVKNFVFGDLSAGGHSVEVVVVSGAVMPDYMDVWDGRTVDDGWYDAQLENEETGLFSFSSKQWWLKGSDVYARNGAFLTPFPGNNANVWFNFTGTDLTVLGYQRDGSSLQVVIDGEDYGLFDMSAAVPFRNQPFALHFTDLGQGPHVVHVFVPATARINAFEVNPATFTSYMPEIKWFDTTAQESLPGASGTGFLSTIAIGDLNADGVVSLVAPGLNGRLYVYRGDGQDAGNGTPIQWTSDLVGPAAEPALADLTGDGMAEIIISGREGTFAFRHDGELLWSNPDVVSYYAPEDFGWGGPSVGNIDLSPEPEIVISAFNDALYVLDHLGNTVFSHAMPGNWPTVPVLADITGNGVLDIVVAQGWTLKVIDYLNGGEVVWSRELPDPIAGNGTFGGPAVADLTGDGRPEIMINWGHVVEVLRDDGTLLWRYETNRTDLFRPSPITVADVTGDGQVNLITASAVSGGFTTVHHLLMVLDAQGNLVWEQTVADNTASASGVAAQDLTGNGVWEILWNGAQDGFLVLNGPDGKRLFNEPYTRSGTVLDYPTLADVDGNGQAEVVMAGRNGLFVIGHPGRWVDSRPVWNQHNYHINNINNDWSVPFTQQNSWELHNTYRTQTPDRNPNCATDNGDLILPRIVSLSPLSGSVLPAGIPLVISGRSIPVSAVQPVLNVWIDGQPVQLLDASGSFFTPIELASGLNSLHIVAADRCGSAELVLQLTGGNDPDDPWSDMGDVSALLGAQFARTTHDRSGERLLVDVQAVAGDFAVAGPVLMAVGGDAEPSLGLLNADGATPQGEPYVIVVPAGETLDSAESSQPRELVFSNLQRAAIDFTPRWIAPVNQPPFFTSIPMTRAIEGQLWRYLIGVADGNGDTVSLSLLAAPQGMALQGEEVSWTPAQSGNYEVLIEAADGQGGTARQGFTLRVEDGGFNSPPIFTSTPPVQVSVGAVYSYAATAFDIDGDLLGFSLQAAPAGLQVDPVSGQVSWPQAQPGQHSIVLVVDDGRGGQASQAWTLYVGEPAGAAPGPAFSSLPPTFAAVGTQYRYAYSLTHAPGATPVVSLADAPATMILDQAGGVIRWVPGSANLGTSVVELRAVDANGLEARQRYDLHVLASLPNQPPYFISTPVPSARIGTPYYYAAEAVDPEFDVLNWSLPNAPAGMTVNPDTGEVNWVPSAPQPAEVTVALQVSDPQGGIAIQEFSVAVRDANSAPVISGSPPTSVIVGQFYGTRILASDADGDPLTFRLLRGPQGMTLHPRNGWLTWSTAGGIPGIYLVELEVVDDWGGRDSLAFNLELIADDEPPTVSIGIDRQPACPGDTVIVCVQASDNVGVASRTLLVDSVDQSLVNNCATITPNELGPLALLATATDTSGLVAEASGALQVVNCDDSNAPVVTLYGPYPGSTHNRRVPIVATIADDTPAALTWTVSLIRNVDGQPVIIAQGTGPVVADEVAIFDPTSLPAGDYRVQIIGSNGMQTGGIEFLLNAGTGIKPGRVQFAAQDVGLSLGGFPLSIGRSYDSLEAGAHGISMGDLGPGWHFSLNASVSDSVRDVYGTDFGSIMSNQPYGFDTRVHVTRPDGVRVGFSFDPVQAAFPALGQYDVRFKPDPGVTDTLRAAEGPTRVWNWGSGFVNYIIPYNPALWELESANGVVYLISETEGLLEIRDVLGGVITVGENGIVSSWGPSIDYVRDAAGRVIEILLPPAGDGAERGKIQYGYDAAGNLSSVTDLAGGMSTFEYNDVLYPHHLTEMYDQLGNPIARMIFDDDGRMVAHCPADGDIGTLEGCSILDFDSGTNLQTVFDPRGFQTQRFFDDRGLIILQRDWYDASNFAEQAWTRDANGHLTQYTDAGGNDTTRTVDEAGNELSRTLSDGTHWQWSYGDCPGGWITFTDPQGNVWQREFDEECDLLAVTDPLGGRIEVEIESGQPVHKTDAVGETRQWNYNAQNLLTASIDERGVPTTSERNGLGQITASTNRNGETVEFEYGDSGNMTRAYWPASSREIELSYSAAGQLTQTTGSVGTQHFEYWPTGQLKRVEHSMIGAPGWWVEYAYDLSGNVVKVTDSAGGITEYEYNGLNQMISIQQYGTGTLEKRVEFEVNPVGLITEIRRYADLAATNPGPRTVFEYGCSSCITSLETIRHLHADGTPIHEITMVRDQRGRVVQRTDNNGVHEYLFDGRAWLIEDSDGPITWDEAGNWLNKPGNGAAVLSYVNDSGHLLLEDNLYQYSYDAAGLMTERTTLSSGEKLIFHHDPDQRLGGMTRLAGGGAVLDQATYKHSPQGWRVSAERNGIQRHYIHDGQNPMVALDGDGQVIWRRMQSLVLDRPFAEERGSQIHWLLTDHIGSVREAVPHGGAPVSFSYNAWGLQLSGPAPSLDDSLRYSGRDFDLPGGLGYYRARTYLPDAARFAEPDPQAPWHYAYAQNDPINLVDPTGEVAAIFYATQACTSIDMVDMLVTVIRAISDPSASNLGGVGVGAVGERGAGAGVGQAGADFFSKVMGLVVDGLNGKEVPPEAGLKLVQELVKNMAIASFLPGACGLRSVAQSGAGL